MTVNEIEAGQGPNAVTQPTAAEAAEAARLAAVQLAAQEVGAARAYQPAAFTGVLPGAPQESTVPQRGRQILQRRMQQQEMSRERGGRFKIQPELSIPSSILS